MRADHQVLNPSKKFQATASSQNEVSAPVFTPKKTSNSEKAYQTASGKKFMRSTQKSNMAAGGEDDNKYLTSAEIERLADPKASMQLIPSDLASKNWETQVNACNVLRSIAIHDSHLLDSSFFRAIMGDLIKTAGSLRSSVSKNGLLMFQDLFNNCHRGVEFELEGIIDVLIKKGNDTNIFISAEAEKSLLSMCSNCNESKVLATIMTHAGNRSALVKAKVARCCEEIIVKLGNKFKNFKEKDKVIDQLAVYLSDASQEVRNNAKQAFNKLSNLCSKDEFEKITMKSLNEQKYNKVKELLEKGFHTSMSDFNPTKQSFYSRRTVRQPRKGNRNGNSASDGFEINGLKQTPSKFKSSMSISNLDDDVRSQGRVDSRNSIYSRRSAQKNKGTGLSYGNNGLATNKTISVINTAQNSRIQKVVPGNERSSHTDTEDSKTSKSTPHKFKHRRIPKRSIKKLDEKSVPRGPDFGKRDTLDNTPVVDERDIFEKLKDPDSKVASKAAENLVNNFSEHQNEIPNNLNTIINSQTSLFASNNENIKMKAEELIDKCVSSVKGPMLAKPICTSITSANGQAKVMLMDKLNHILPQIADENPVLLSKHVLPVVYALLDDRSKIIKKKAEELILTLYGLIGSALIEFSPSNKLQMILDII